MDLLGHLQLTLTPPSQASTQYSPPIATATDGLAEQTSEEKQRLQKFLKQQMQRFRDITGPTTLATHHIRLKQGIEPIKQRYRPRNPAMQQIIDNEIAAMERDGVIEPSHSPWNSPIVLTKKKDGGYRFCIDFREVNKVSEPDAYPLPQITATLDKLRGARYLTTLDLKQGYWQVPLSPASRPITAFTVPGRGLRQFRVMPFGLHAAPATFQRLLDHVLGPELEPYVFVYLDDIIIVNRTFEEHLQTLEEVFRRLRGARLRINTEKCQFCRTSLKYLGHVVDQQGIRTDPAKTSAVANWPTPTTIRQIRRFLGMASWYRRFVENFSTIAAPLTRLTRKNVRWTWGAKEDTAFQTLKQALISVPVLACPDFTKKFILQTDASNEGLGAVLTQNFEEGERVIAYASRTLNQAERNYSATELECLAVVWGIHRMRDYLEGYTFTVLTDHQSLRWLQKMESPSGRLGRWRFQLQQYNFDIRYRKGSSNQVADALSRQPEVSALTEGLAPQCNWYRRVEAQVRQQPHEVPDYQIRNGRLIRHILHDLNFTETPAQDQWKFCVPREQRGKIIQEYHDKPTAGHLGIAKTIARIARRYYWPGMFRDIAKYVRSCTNCLAHKAEQRKPAGLMHANPVQRPWEQVTVDLIGPLPRSRQGHIWLLTMQDRYTKWLEMRPLRKATASAVTRGIADDIIYRHGCPDTLISDNGTQLKSSQLARLLETFKIHHRTAPVRAPHCNPVERANRTIKTMIQYVDRDHKRWDEHLPELKFAFNTAKNEATNFTPAFLNYGHELIGAQVDERANRPPADAPNRVQQRLQDTQELVRIQLARAFQQQERPYNLRRREWRPKLDEWVWKKTYVLSDKSKARNAKPAPRYIGPLQVRKILSPVIVDLRDRQGKWYRHIHVQDLKPDANNRLEDEESE